MARRQQKDLVFLVFRSECAASMREAFGAAAQEVDREAHQDRVERAVRHFEQVRPAQARGLLTSPRRRLGSDVRKGEEEARRNSMGNMVYLYLKWNMVYLYLKLLE